MKPATKKKREKIKELKAARRAYVQSLRQVDKDLAKLSKRKMKPGGGRSKGNGFENEIAKMIVAAFSCFNVDAKDCYRTPSSGGHRYAKHEDPGDLVISKKLRTVFPCHVECKFYKNIDLHPFFIGEKKWGKSWIVKAWLKQVTESCTNEELWPLLVFKANQKQVLCAFPRAIPGPAWGLKITPVLHFRYQGQLWDVVKFSRLLREMVKHKQEATK